MELLKSLVRKIVPAPVTEFTDREPVVVRTFVLGTLGLLIAIGVIDLDTSNKVLDALVTAGIVGAGLHLRSKVSPAS